MKTVTKIKDTTLKLTLGVAQVVMLFMAFIVTLEIILRWVFGTSTMVSVDFAAYGMGIVCYWGAAQAVDKDDFVRIDIFYDRFKGKGLKIFNILIDFLLLFFNINITYYFFKLLQKTIDRGMLANNYYSTPLSVPRAIMFGGIFAFNIYLICRTILDFAAEESKFSKRDIRDGIADGEEK